MRPTPHRSEIAAMLDRESRDRAGLIAPQAREELVRADLSVGGYWALYVGNTFVGQYNSEIGASSAAACINCAARAREHALREELEQTRAALAPLDAVVHYLSIEDTDTDPVEAIRQRERAAADRALRDTAVDDNVRVRAANTQLRAALAHIRQECAATHTGQQRAHAALSRIDGIARGALADG